MRRNKGRNKLLLLLLLLLGIGIGFAALSTTLKINGTATINKSNWSVYWDSVGNVRKTQTVTETVPAEVDENDNTKVNFTVVLNEPGDFYEFQVDAVNAGSLNAMVNVVATIINDDETASLPDYLNLSITYADDSEIEQYHLLPKADNSTTPITPTRERYKVRLEYDKDIDEAVMEAIADNTVIGIEIDIPYEQADKNAYDRFAPTFIIGNYFILVPDKETATTTTPGFSGSTSTADQTLWRVININEDGTTEAIADSASTGEFTVSGVDGYKYYILGLQDIATCYAKEGYTVSTRMMGYDGQTPIIQDTSAFDGTSTNAPSTNCTPTPTTGTGTEYMGGVTGDTLYLKDLQLVMNAYDGTIEASPAKQYLLASRYYDYYSDTNFGFYGVCSGCWDNFYSRYYGSSWGEYSSSYAVRPIITLRSGIKTASGTGSKTDPYILK